MDLRLEGKKIIVTGAASGVGCAICLGLIAEGANPILIDKVDYRNSQFRKIIREKRLEFKESHYYVCDISKTIELENVVSSIQIVHGLVNNAALLGEDLPAGRTIDEWDRRMNINARAGFHLVELLEPKMQEGGSIVNIGSIDLRMCAPNVVLYNAAKGAMSGVTVAYAVTLAKRCIRVNMVSPGNIRTTANEAQYRSQEDRKLLDGFERRTPMKRSVRTDEVANTVLFLLSEVSSGITGEDIIVDCGYTRALYDPEWAAHKYK